MALLMVAFVALAQHYGWFGQAAKGVVTNQPGLCSISRYVDGDTVSVTMNGTEETVHFIGVDAPETYKPNTPVQCYGPAASAYTKNRIATTGGKVRLMSDDLSTNRDRYNRLLRYVYLPTAPISIKS